jgi:Phage integrase family
MAALPSLFATPRCKDRGPQTLAECMVLFESSMANEISCDSVAAKRRISAARNTAKRLQQLLGTPVHLIRLDDLVEIDSKLVAYVEAQGINHQSAIQYVCDKNKLLEHAHAVGWTCASFALRQAWKPVRAALKGDARGASGIIEDAIRRVVRPCQYTQRHLLAWQQAQLKYGRSLLTLTAEECHFRRQLRRAGLEKMFACFDISSKNPSVYAARLDQLHPDLRREIETVMEWKTAVYVSGRDAKLAIRPPSQRNLRKALLQVCGFAIHQLGRTDLMSLRQVIVPEIICPLIDWLATDRKCKTTTITTRLSGIHYLACEQHELFGGSDYSWILTKLNRIEKEPKHLLENRKKQKYVRYDLLASVPRQIRNERLADKQLDAVERAWRVHDELFISWPLFLPWRQRNLRELAVSGPGLVSLIYDEIPPDLKHELDLPVWARNALKKNSRQRFWQFKFSAMQTKGNRAVRGIIPRELIALLEMYLKRYRPRLVGLRDPGTLFLNRNGEGMRNKDVLALVTRLTIRYTGTRVTPHLLRDVYAANFLANRGKIETLQQELWQADIATTYKYCKRFDVSQAVIYLDEYFAKIDHTRRN